MCVFACVYVFVQTPVHMHRLHMYIDIFMHVQTSHINIHFTPHTYTLRKLDNIAVCDYLNYYVTL